MLFDCRITVCISVTGMCKRFPWFCRTLSHLCRTVTLFFSTPQNVTFFREVPYVNSIIYVCSKYCSSKRCYFSKGCTRKGRNLKEFSRSYTSIDRQLSFFFFCFHFIITYSLICVFLGVSCTFGSH